MSEQDLIKETAIKNQHKVLKYIISCPIEKYEYNVYKPVKFRDNFPFLTSDHSLKTVLCILISKDLIKVDFMGDDSKDIVHSIKVTPKGYDYFHQIRKEKLSFWLPLISSSVLSATAILVSVLTILMT